jgi:tetratricopeptide (TPR) repeat protein
MGAAGSVLDLSSLDTADVEKLVGTQMEADEMFVALIRKHRIDGKLLVKLQDTKDVAGFLKSIHVEDKEVDYLASRLTKLVSLRKSSPLGFDCTDQLSLLGLTMSSLLKFVDSCGGLNALNGLSTEDVSNKFIASVANETPSSYCERMLPLSAAESITGAFADANVFICHARSELFSDLVASLRNHVRDREEVVMWIDVFCQSDLVGAPNTHVKIKSVIARIDHTVVIMNSWQKRVPLQRTWCLWEMYCSLLRAECQLNVILPATQTGSLISGFATNHDNVENTLCLVDLQNSSGCDYEDKQQILKSIQQTTSVNDFNKTMYSFLRNWLLKQIEDTVLVESDVLFKSKLQLSLAHLYQADGNFKLAQTLYSTGLLEFRTRLGNLSVITLHAISDYALCCKNCGEYEECVMLYKECLELRTVLLGADHVDTIHTMNALSVAYLSREQFSEAEPVCSLCYETLRKKHGVGMHETLVAMNNYGHVLKSCRKYDMAEIILRECWQVRYQLLGEDHLETLSTLTLLASTLIKLNKTKEAKPMLVLGLSKFSDLLGVDHPRSQRCKNLLETLASRQKSAKSFKQSAKEVDRDQNKNESANL